MADVWDKLDRYTKSDYLNSSDDENHEVYFEQTDHLCISTKKFSQTEAVYDESLCSEDVDKVEELAQDQQEIQENIEKQEIKGNTYDTLLNEMKKSELHCNSETRNVQEKLDKMSSEKSQQKDELNEMQHKAQVISKSARMSATDVLSAITSSETMDHEESGEMEEYYDRIRSTTTDENTPKESPESEINSSSGTSSDVDLPSIAPLSMPLNTGVMKSKANVARQGSMKARRKPTTVKRKSWTPGMDEYDIREQDEETVEDVEQNEQGGTTWVTTQARNQDELTGSCSESSSENEKEVVKPHMRSAIAMPGLGDALKIQLTRSELKRPTALSLAKTAKDAKVNEIIKEDKVETPSSKPDWMEEVEKRKKQSSVIPQRRHKTLPERSSEIDALFEQRKQGQSSEPVDSRGQENASEASRPKSFSGEDLDPELQKMFEKRKNLTPLESEEGTFKDVERPKSLHENKIDPELRKLFEKRKNLTPLVGEGDVEQPKNFHGDKIDPELSRMFEKRRNLKPFEGDDDASDEGTVAKKAQRPKSYHGDELDSELNKMFLRRKNLRPVEGTTSNRVDEDQVLKPRNVHLQNTQATELDKIFEKRKPLRPVGEAQSHTPQSVTGEFSNSVVNSSPELRQTSGIVRARFHDTKLEPLPSRGEILKVATVSAGEVRTARQVPERRRMSPEEHEEGRGGTRLPNSGQSGPSKPPRTLTSGAQITEFAFDGRGASQATVRRIPIGESGPPRPPRAPTSGAQVAEFTFDGRGGSQATMGRIPVQSGPPKPHRTMTPHAPTTPERGNTGGEQTAEFVSKGVGHASGSAGNRRGILIPIGQRRGMSPEEENSGREASGAQVAQFDFDGSSAASRATVGQIPVGDGREQTSPSPSKGDHVMSDAITKKKKKKKKVVSWKSDTYDFIEQLSRKQVPGKSSSQGKFVTKTRSLDNNHSSSTRRELYTDKEYPIPNMTHDRQHSPREGTIPLPQYVSPLEDLPSRNVLEDLPSRNLPPISNDYTTPPQNSNLRELPRSVSHPPTSQLPNHLPLHTKTSDPQHLYAPRTPRGPKEGRPHPVRVREVKDPVREMGPDPNRVSHDKPRPNISRDVNGYDGLGNGESSGDGSRYSDSVASMSNGRYDAKLDQGTRRGRSPQRSEYTVIHGIRNSEGLGDETSCKDLGSDRYTDQRIDGRANVQRMDRVLSPDRSTGERMNRARSPDRSTGQRRDRVLSPDRSTGPRMNRVLSPDRATEQRMNSARSPDRSTDQRRDRVLSPDRSTDQRKNRVVSPDGSDNEEMNDAPHYPGNQVRNGNVHKTEGEMIVRRGKPDRSSDEKRLKNRERPGGERTWDHGLKERIKNSNGLKRSYQSSIENESVGTRNSGSGGKMMTRNDHTSTQSRSTDFEKRSRGMRVSSSAGKGLNRDNVERPKPVSVTVTSLSESHVNAMVPVVRSHDKDGMVYGECVINGMVNGDVGKRGVRIEGPGLDIQNPEAPAIPKWKQELQARKRLQRERQGETTTRQKESIKPEHPGNDIAEWQKRLQGIRKTWGSEASGVPETSQGDHMSQSEYHQKKNKENTKDGVQDTETFV